MSGSTHSHTDDKPAALAVKSVPGCVAMKSVYSFLLKSGVKMAFFRREVPVKKINAPEVGQARCCKLCADFSGAGTHKMNLTKG